ncbi:MAG: hypothetical protein KY476_07845 [Planctomycetes bacterium]|nr:hypothetical protein [Planctomycetota bacterium]
MRFIMAIAIAALICQSNASMAVDHPSQRIGADGAGLGAGVVEHRFALCLIDDRRSEFGREFRWLRNRDLRTDDCRVSLTGELLLTDQWTESLSELAIVP